MRLRSPLLSLAMLAVGVFGTAVAAAVGAMGSAAWLLHAKRKTAVLAQNSKKIQIRFTACSFKIGVSFDYSQLLAKNSGFMGKLLEEVSGRFFLVRKLPHFYKKLV